VATAKAGLAPGSAVTFFWEGCHVEESDDKALGLIAKDGDTFVLVPDIQSEEVGNQSAPSSSGRSGQQQQQQPESSVAAAVETSKPATERRAEPTSKAVPSKRTFKTADLKDPSYEPLEKRERRAEPMALSQGGGPSMPPLLPTHRSQSIDSGG